MTAPFHRSRAGGAFLLREAWLSIGGSRLRTFLAMLGIMIGIGSVVLMLAIGGGSKRSVEKAIESLGTNMLIVTPGAEMRARLFQAKNNFIDVGDATAIAQLPTVIAAAPTTEMRVLPVKANRMTVPTNIIGTTGDFFIVRNWPFTDGESFTAEDTKLARPLAVVGADVAKRLFPGATGKHDSVLGRTIRISGMTFNIIGILAPKGADLSGNNQDQAIFVPVTAFKDRLWGGNAPDLVQSIYAKATSKDAMQSAVEDITSLLRQRHGLRENVNNNFTVYDMASIMKVASDTTEALSMLLGAIASISLVVGGIGIMNIMLVTVTERIREIGIRKAIGATESQILFQFLLEAIIIAWIGSIVGLAVGFGSAFIAERWFALTVAYSIWPALLALSVAALVGLLSGIYPAYRAAKLQPIDALRM